MWYVSTVYIAGAVLSYGLFLGYWQGLYPTLASETLSDDRRLSLYCAIVWPAVLIVYVLHSFQIGFKKPRW